MEIEFGSGSLFIQKDNQVSLLGDCLPYVQEITELNTCEYVPTSINTKAMEFSCDMEVNSATLENMISYNPLNHVDCLYFNIPIMIQARWHKKPRIRKKWLKRYGMKKDIVKVKSRAVTITPNTENIYEAYCDDGILGSWQSFEINIDDIEYIWNQYQKHRDIKIEW